MPKVKPSSTTKVKISDIARESGVSLSTVSMVLRNKGAIHPDTRLRVLEASKALGYRPKEVKREQPQSKLRNVGLIVKSRPNDPPRANLFYSHIAAGIEAACRPLRINMLYATIPVNDDNQPMEVPNLLSDESVDALVFVGGFVDETLSLLLAQHSVPTVLVDVYSNSSAYDSVISENFQGAYEAVTYLLQKGHRQIGLIASTPPATPGLLDRRRGYLQALKDQGISTPYIADCSLDSRDAFDAITELLTDHPEITAIFGCNDAVTIAAVRVAQALGRRVPDDLSAIGFDDIDPAHLVMPPLTTMQVDKVDMGRRAVALLLHRAEFPDSARVTMILRPRLVERESVNDVH